MSTPDMPQNAQPDFARRAAWALVIITTLLFVLAFVAVVWGFMHQAGRLGANRPPLTLTLTPGAHIVSSRMADGRLLLEITTPSGPHTLAFDPSTGKPLP